MRISSSLLFLSSIIFSLGCDLSERQQIQPNARVQTEVQRQIASVKNTVLTQPDSASKLLQKAFILGEGSDLPDTIWSDLYFLKGIIYYYRGNPDTAITYFNRALNKATAARAGFYSAKNHLELGKAFTSLSNYDQAVLHLNQAVHLFDSLQMPDKCAYAWTLLGGLYNDMGLYDKAAKELVVALEALEAKGDPRVLAALCINLSNSFSAIGSEIESVRYLKKALEIAQKAEDYPNVASAMINLGLKYREINPDSAMQFYKEALKIQQGSESVETRLSTLFNIGNLHLDKKKTRAADIYFDSVLALSSAIAMPKGIAMALAGKGRVAAIEGRYAAARTCFKEGLHIADSLQNLEMQIQFSENLNETEAQLGDYQAALQSLRCNVRLRDSMALTEKAKAVHIIEQKYQNQQKDLEIASLNAESDLQKRIITANGRITFIAILLALVLGAFAFIYARLSRQRWDAYRRLLERYEASLAHGTPEARTREEHRESVQPNQNEALVNNLHAYFKQEHPYLNPELRVDHLADQMGVSYKMLNTALKDVEGINLTTFVNRYRVETVVEMFKKPEFQEVKTQYIAQKAGFGSASAFYVAFQEITGLQPSNYRKILAQKMNA